MTDRTNGTPLSRAARMHALAKRSQVMEAVAGIEVALDALAEVDEAHGTRKALDVELGKLRDLLSTLPPYRPPERGQGERVDEELAERVRVARAGEDTREVEV